MNGQRSFTSVQTCHTHTLPLAGWCLCKWGEGEDEGGDEGWDERENEMKDYLTGTRGGERKRRGKEKTHTNTPGPERANPEKAREKKSGGRRTRNKTSGGGGRRKRLNQPKQSENLRLPGHEQDPTYLGRKERMKIGDQMGD